MAPPGKAISAATLSRSGVSGPIWIESIGRIMLGNRFWRTDGPVVASLTLPVLRFRCLSSLPGFEFAGLPITPLSYNERPGKIEVRIT
jgi:hypothetical protein